MAIKEISKRAVSAFYKTHSRESERGYPKRDCKYYFVTKNSVPRGYICVSKKSHGICIDSIFVRPEDRRKGYGSKLIKYVTYNGLTTYAAADPDCLDFFYSLGFVDDFLIAARENRIMVSK